MMRNGEPPTIGTVNVLKDILRSSAAYCAAALALALGGCTFSRVAVNGHVRDLDTSWIKPGLTTRDDVIARLGRPPSVLGVGGGRRAGDGLSAFFFERLSTLPSGIDVQGEDVDAMPLRAFRWSVVENRGRELEFGYWIVPTFSEDVLARTHDILILFDERGVVTLLSRTALVDDVVKVLEWKEAK